ncbi:MAG: hypothetical protein JWO03_2187 [Bacteroidetes bacterium]|nr:hypothetical protein [Bacteroidota bacterium]
MTAASFAQSNTGRSVFNSGGGTIGTPGGMQMLMSIGEPIAGMVQTNEVGISQGFLVASKTIVAATTAIDEVSTTENAMVYPNPFSNVIHVNSIEDNIHIYVFNVMGQEVYNAPYQPAGADLSGLATGMYVVHAMSNGKTIINTKILKQ